MVGVQHLPENGTQLPLSHIVIHENFKNFMSNDIALLKLKEPIAWSPLVQPVCLPSTKLLPSKGTLCWMIVWGRPSTQGAWRRAGACLFRRLIRSFLPSFPCLLRQHTFPEPLPLLHAPLASVDGKTHVTVMDLSSQS